MLAWLVIALFLLLWALPLGMGLYVALDTRRKSP